MDPRAALSGPRPRLPQRAVSGAAIAFPTAQLHRPTLPPRLDAIRSASQPIGLVDLPAEDVSGTRRRSAASFLDNGPVVTSPDGMVSGEDEDDIQPPPSKRVKRSGEDFIPGGEDADEESGLEDAAHKVQPGSPLPVLPSTPSVAKRTSAHRRHRFGIEPAARKSHGADSPAIATRVPLPKNAADFSPWNGNHSEDILGENVVKTGFFDKPQGVNQAECGSAKPTVSLSLSQKNSHSLSLLGYLFIAVLEKKQTSGKCTAPSTFKPPPRVTVTDTKREAWLRDLANPDIPLRKQSRTIPHGIRGKLLMEQCMAKGVPLQRAIWLAKCVGANELRAFRRKGVSGSAAATGEAKWVSEWTTHVEQFLRDVVSACGKEGWQQQINFAVKLAAAFYSERLLDTAHFLDWIVSSFADAALSHLPIWMVLAQMYWKDIVLFAHRGRRLAVAILRHLDHLVKTNHQTAHAALRGRLQKLLAALAVSSPACLVLPRTWTTYRYLFTNGSTDEAAITAFRAVVKRNDWLGQALSKSAAAVGSPTLDLFAALDAVTLEFEIGKLAHQCLNFLPDIVELTTALFDWASTPFRVGQSRIYLTARIIAFLHAAGYDTDAAVLNVLEPPTATKELTALQVEYIHRTIVELNRLGAFSVGRYMQRLITNGIAASAGGTRTCATGLIAALPSSGLPVHVLNTRIMLMRRLGYVVDSSRAVTSALEAIEQGMEFPSALDSLSLSAKFEVCSSISDRVANKAKATGIAIDDFCLARKVVEHAGDLRSLATLLRSALPTDNVALLATACDSINLHSESLAALEDFSTLVDDLQERYISLRSSQPLDRTLILALTGLFKRRADKASFTRLLQNDLALCEQLISSAVCSPASDSVIGMQASILEVDEDLDAVFASGNTMDERLMQRVFHRVMQRAAKASAVGPVLVQRVCGWLGQLRSVDSAGGLDGLVQEHVRSVLAGGADGETQSPSDIVLLVNSGVLSLDGLLDMAAPVESTTAASRLLSVLLSTSATEVGLDDVDAYRFHLQQQRCQDEQAPKIRKLICTACESDDFVPDDKQILAFLIRAVARQPEATNRGPGEAGQLSETLRRNLRRIMSAILAQGHEQMAGSSSQLAVRDIINQTTPLSLPFSATMLRYMPNPSVQNEQESSAFADTILEVFQSRSEIWPQLLEFAGDVVNKTLRDWAQERITRLITGTDADGSEATYAEAERCLDLFAVCSNAMSERDNGSVLSLVVEAFKELDRTAAVTGPHDSERVNRSSRPLRILLDLTALSLELLDKERSETTQQNSTKISLLATLCALLARPEVQVQHDLAEHIFDVASVIADNLPESALLNARQHSPPTVLTDPRVQCILGDTPASSKTWLLLASHAQPFPGANASSQQQRLLNRNASSPLSQHQHTSSASGPSTANRLAMAAAHHQRAQSGGGTGGSSSSASYFPPRQNSALGNHAGPASAAAAAVPMDIKTTPFAPRQWEMISDAAPVMADNDASLSLRLFGARKV